jgi:hypothetical protein
MTRTTGEITTNTISEFYVYGYARSNATTLFTNERVFKKDGAWDYNNTQFWEANTPYAFTAIAPSGKKFDENNEVKKDAEGNEIIYWTYTAADNATDRLAGKGSIVFNNKAANGDKDLVTAVETKTTESISSGVDPVHFTLKHRLARVKFLFKNTYTNQYINVSNVQMTGLRKSGTYTLAGDNSKWSFTDEDKQELNLTFNSKTLAVGNGTEGYPTGTKYIIPEGETNYHVKIDATREKMSADETGYVQDALQEYTGGTDLYFNAEEGNSYVITIEFNGTSNAITFTVTEVIKWDDEQEINDTPSVPTTADYDISGGEGNTDKVDVEVKEQETEDPNVIYDPDGNEYIMGNSNIALLEYPSYLYYWDATANEMKTDNTYLYSRRATYFQKLSNDCYYVKVKELVEFKIIAPTSENMHKKPEERLDSKTILGGWGAIYDANNIVYANIGQSYKLNYTTTNKTNKEDRDYVYTVDASKTPLSEVTLYFYPNESILVIEANSENDLAYTYQEYHPSWGTDEKYGVNYAGYTSTNPNKTDSTEESTDNSAESTQSTARRK